MSLVGTLGKVAIGMIAARGIGKMMGGSSTSSNALGGLLGSVLGGSGSSASNMLGGLLGGGSQQGGGLGSILSGMMGGQQQAASQSGGVGGLLDSLGGGAAGGGLGALLNQALAGTPANQIEATADQEQEAELMLRAMICAAKADGEIDAEEQRKLTEHLGDDVTQEEMELVRREMTSQTSLEDLVADVPKGMEQQVYFMSLLAIDLDSQAEAQYLDKLAKGLNISPQQANAIHEQLGVPKLYA
jgi:uncharacterized membrane protein YebE (DUF533 family)